MAADIAQERRSRYNIELGSLYGEVQDVAEKYETSVAEVIRKSIRLGLLAAKLQDDPNAALIIREGEREREVMIFL
jgi:hypothetical protein